MLDVLEHAPLSIESVSKVFAGEVAVDNVSFTVKSGVDLSRFNSASLSHLSGLARRV